MPIQINEVVIRAVVSNNPESTSGSATASCHENGEGQGGNDSIDEIVERVLEILKSKQER